MVSKYDAAVLYTSWGWVVHPLHHPAAKVNSPGKQPVLEGWQNRKKAADDELKTWFIDNDYNIGLVCGKESGIMVVDYDHELFWENITKDLGSFTLRAHRTSGRGHVYCKYNPVLKSQKHHILGIEVLSDGSNAVLPPSIHESGDVYAWTNPDVPVIEMPPVLLERLEILFKVEQNLVQQMSEVRPCFKKLWNKGVPDALHGADGREAMLAWVTELKAKGAGIDEILMLSRLVYKEGFDSKETIKEWKQIKGKPWRCIKIKERLSGIINCAECSKNNSIAKNPIPDFITVADRLLEKHNFTTIAETDEILYYNSGTFHPLGQVMIKKEVQGMVNNVNTHTINEVINTIKRKTYTPISELNKNPNYIPIENGILDLATFNIIPYNPSFLLTTRVPVTYDPNAVCPAIDKFFSEILGSKIDIDALHEFFGYCLLRSYVIQKAFMLVGGGGNGKSTLLALLKYFLGEENVSSIALQEIEDNHFAAANLFGKLANIYADLPPKALSATGKIKMLVGGDIITAERKFGGFVSFVNHAKMIFSTNQMPLSYDDTDAFYRRWVIINFPNTFDETQGKGLLEKLITKDELSGLLNHALRGLKQLLENGRFSNQKSIDDIREQYVRMSDSIQAFVWDCVEESANNYIEKKKLYTMYGRYCKAKNIPISTEKRFYSRFPMLVRAEEQRITLNEKRVRVFSGVVIKLDITNASEVNKNNSFGLDGQDVQDSLSLLETLDNITREANISRVGATIKRNLGHAGHAGQDSDFVSGHPGQELGSSIFEQAVKLLHNKYDSFPKPSSLDELARLRASMEAYLQNEIDVAEGIDVDTSCFVSDYLKARAWQSMSPL